MTMRRLFLVLVPTVLLCANAVPAEKDDLKSGPQPGDNLPGPFPSLVVHSEKPGWVGLKMDFFEAYGTDPAVLVFARDITKPVTSLVEKLDAEVAKRKSAKLRAIVVILSDNDALEANLEEYAKKQGFKNVNLAMMEPTGPKHYQLAKEADVTVLLYKRRKVEANHAFEKGELNDRGVEKILADVPKVAPER
jgi:predicted TIM-barrel fold metal-dependent hydrolase